MGNPASDYLKEYRTEHISVPPAGWSVKTILPGPDSEHQVRIAFPPGRRKKGSGKLVSILHPLGENPKKCKAGSQEPEVRSQNQRQRKDNEWGVGEWYAVRGSGSGFKPPAHSGPYGSRIEAEEAARKYGHERISEGKPGHAAAHYFRVRKKKGNPNGAAAGWKPYEEGWVVSAKVDGTPQRWIYHTKEEAEEATQKAKTRGFTSIRLTRAGNPNGAAAAAQLYTDFHGRAPSEVLKFQEDLMASGDYTALGDMGSLWLDPVEGDPERWPIPSIEFEKKDGVKLATDPGGKQLYLVGGNQTLPLDYLAKKGVETDKRFIALGEVYGISYRTEKKFDGYRTIEYAHEFGEKTGERPFAYYDAELERIVLVGGAYSIADPTDALGASPGIVN